MNTLTTELREVTVENVAVTKDTLELELADGRTVTAPLAWYPRLLHGTAKERANWRLIGGGEGVHWPDLAPSNNGSKPAKAGTVHADVRLGCR
jgi:hypothetical protein